MNLPQLLPTTSLAVAPAAGAVLDVEHVADLPRCACGGAPRHFQMDTGHYFLCAERCNRPGSGVFQQRSRAEQAWITLQAQQAPR